MSSQFLGYGYKKVLTRHPRSLYNGLNNEMGIKTMGSKVKFDYKTKMYTYRGQAYEREIRAKQAEGFDNMKEMMNRERRNNSWVTEAREEVVSAMQVMDAIQSVADTVKKINEPVYGSGVDGGYDE